MRLIQKAGFIVLVFLAISLRLLAGPLAPGNVSGYVFNYYGLAISGAYVGLENGSVTITNAEGYYFLSELSEGEKELGCGKSGYNTTWITVTVISADTVYQDFTLTQPSMAINPLVIEETLNPGEYQPVPISILNSGTGPLNWSATINYFSMPVVPCQYSIALCDTWGDGWSGSSVDVLVNDSVVLDNITLTSGAGPLYFYFTVNTGDEITTDFNPGSFVTEPFYFIYNGAGEQVWFSPAGSNGPPDVPAGQLIAACSGGEWLTLNDYEGELQPFGGTANIHAYLDAAGMNSGESYAADIVFTPQPDVGQITVPVTLNVQGTAINPPENLVLQLIDPVLGKVKLTWDWSGEGFQFFVIKRDGGIIATTTSRNYVDILPGHGTFCYTVQAFYSEGITSPTGPECIEWPNPVLNVDPVDLEGWVWTGYSVDVFTTISNTGEGTLSYSFPEFAAMDLLKGHDINGLRGAGGPDSFGYVWIDSDEPGGPVFKYTDISTTGTPVFGLSDDNIVGPFNIGFDFWYYGDVKSQFWINSNGCIGFTSNYITIQNTTLPSNSSVYKDFIAWMWDDLECKTGSSQVFYQSYPDKLIIQFKNYERHYHTGLTMNAEVEIYKNGKIIILYNNFSQGINLDSCTVGLQSSNPSLGLQVVYNAYYLHNDLALFFRVPGDFITDVDPAYGTIPQGGSSVITITYDSRDYIPGPYTQELSLESNDLNKPDFIINNTMNVYSPAKFSGYVYDLDNDEPLNGVVVTAGPYQASTGEDGHYTLYVDEGSYNVVFEKLGYLPAHFVDTMAVKEQETVVDAGMWESNYAPSFVFAQIVTDNTCQVNWSLPQGPYEIIMDDGEADDFFVYAHAGSWNAVKFTPSAYPATVIGGEFNVGDGSFPGPFLGTDFGVAVFDDDGANGLPGTMIDSNGVTVNNSGWVSLDWLNAEITEGSFYLAMYQSQNVPHAAPIGVDTDNPTHFKSYSKFLSGNWNISPLQDFMIRAWVNGPQGNMMAVGPDKELKAVPRVPANWKNFAMTRSGSLPRIQPGYGNQDVTYRAVEGKGGRDVINYRIGRYVAFNPDSIPSSGTLYELATTNNLSWQDNLDPLMAGWIAYGVKALYSSGDYSDYTISNVVGYEMDRTVTFHISLITGEAPDNVEITLQGKDYPHETLFETTSADGTAIFETVWKGNYKITVKKIGYVPYIIDNDLITVDKVFNLILTENKYAPSNLYVDPVTLIGTWDVPIRTALKEGFEETQFPPAGWQSLTESDGNGWFRSRNASSTNFTIPPWDNFYAAVNNDLAGSENNGCCDYLVTPQLDLRECEGFVLGFDSYYDGTFGQLASVEYSLDNGQSWEMLDQLQPDSVWTKIELDLSSFSGAGGPPMLLIAFHSDDHESWASGWAIDNVTVRVPSIASNYIDFSIFLDNAYIGSTSEPTWDFAPLAYGQTYTASVAAHYSSGLSGKSYYTFQCKYLYPPQNLSGSAPDNAAILSWDPPVTFPFNLHGYNVYRDNALVAYVPHLGGWEPQGYVDEDLEPGIYNYAVTGVYDLAPYGYPGETGESMKDGPEPVTVDYCIPLEFYETWDLGSFGVNNWKSDGPNWTINGMTGNPPPVAQFNGEILQSDYKMSLESYPLCAQGYTEGNIMMDFDLELYSVQNTGREFLDVEIWNWISKEWIIVGEFSNNEGSYDWSPKRLDITDAAMNKVFKIRFTAKGTFSPDIRGWFVDNIHVYRLCPPPPAIMIDPDFYEGIRIIFEVPEYGKTGSGNGTRELQGYDIYRSIDGGDYELIESSAGIPYTDTGIVTGSTYCYRVSSVWESEIDQCVSELSNEACLTSTGTGERIQPGEAVSIYPNPATDHLTVQSSEVIYKISINNSLGLQVYSQLAHNKRIDLNIANYPAGAYVIRLLTASGETSRLLTVQR
jgi:hypothetical protein